MPYADVVLEGGGIKGIALVGALEVLEDRGYTFKRIAGTSAGAIVGAMLAVGIPATKMVEIMKEAPYASFQDGTWFDRTVIGKAAGLWFRNGIYRGEKLQAWLDEKLSAHRGTDDSLTFGDIPYHDQERMLPEQERFKLVVTASDITKGALRYLPWHYDAFGKRRETERIVDAVRASMSIPFFYRPVRWDDQSAGTTTLLVDGGMLSNYPISIFDTATGTRPRWPTLGIKLSGDPKDKKTVPDPGKGPFNLAIALLQTMMGFYDLMHIENSDAVDRTIFVDTEGVRATQFDLSTAERNELYNNGKQAAINFLDGTDERPAWDFEAYIARHRV